MLISYTFDEYQKLAARTINQKMEDGEKELHALHGLAGEVGEIHSLYQKVYQGHVMCNVDLIKEMGDLLWFIAELATANGLSLDEIAKANIQKLMKRYPDGFDADRSVNREVYEGGQE